MNPMKCSVLACVAILAGTLPAHAAFQLVYEVAGVYDNGGAADTGVATVFHCSNLSGNEVQVRVRVFASDGSRRGNALIATLGDGDSFTFATHPTVIFIDADGDLNTAAVQGRAQILATVPSAIVCTSDMLDAASATPVFMSPRRMIRFPRAASGGED